MLVLQPFTNIITVSVATAMAEVCNIVFFPFILFVNVTLDIIVELCN